MSKPQEPSIPINNRLLAALPSIEYQQLLPNLETIELSQGTVLHQPKEAIRYVYFPTNFVVSLLSIAPNAETIEIGLIGREGMVGISVALGIGKAPYQALVQIPGSSVRMHADLFKKEFKRCETLNRLLSRYTHAFLTQLVQLAACNHFHSVGERLCFWLLATQDRTQLKVLPYTQDFIAQMLGTSRQDINVAVSVLQENGLIRSSRGQIYIIDRSGLETRVCECYQIIKSEFDDFLAS